MKVNIIPAQQPLVEVRFALAKGWWEGGGVGVWGSVGFNTGRSGLEGGWIGSTGSTIS